jgi:hypothetical protein
MFIVGDHGACKHSDYHLNGNTDFDFDDVHFDGYDVFVLDLRDWRLLL